MFKTIFLSPNKKIDNTCQSRSLMVPAAGGVSCGVSWFLSRCCHRATITSANTAKDLGEFLGDLERGHPDADQGVAGARPHGAPRGYNGDQETGAPHAPCGDTACCTFECMRTGNSRSEPVSDRGRFRGLQRCPSNTPRSRSLDDPSETQAPMGARAEPVPPPRPKTTVRHVRSQNPATDRVCPSIRGSNGRRPSRLVVRLFTTTYTEPGDRSCSAVETVLCLGRGLVIAPGENSTAARGPLVRGRPCARRRVRVPVPDSQDPSRSADSVNEIEGCSVRPFSG